MEKVKIWLDKYFFNVIYLKILMIIAVMITSVPLLHFRFGGYVKILLVYGILLCIYEIFICKQFKWIKEKLNILLLVFLASYLITIFLNRDMNLVSNLKSFAYMALFFCAFFIRFTPISYEKMLSELKIISSVVIFCTFVLSIVSFMTYAFQISGYYVTEMGYMYYGMYDHRLWGVYNANTGSTLNAISILLSIGFLLKTNQKKLIKFLNGFNVGLQVICLVLTGSRAALYTLILLIGFGVWIVFVKKYTLKTWKNKILSGILCIGTVVLCIGMAYVVKKVVAYIPSGIAAIQSTIGNEDEQDIHIEEYDLERMEKVENREGGFFNGRIDIWKASLKAFEENPLWGITRENLYQKAVKYMEGDLWGESLNKGGTHNIYICILVSSGILGFLIMAIFGMTLMLSATMKIFKEKNISNWMIIVYLLVIMFYITEFVEARILYQVGVFNVLFWIYCGYLKDFTKDSSRRRVIEKEYGNEN